MINLIITNIGYSQIKIENNTSHYVNWQYSPISNPFSYNSAQLKQLIKANFLPFENNYYVKSNDVFEIIKSNHNLNKVLFYDKQGNRRLVIPDNACEAPNFIDHVDTNLSSYPMASPKDSLKAMRSKFILFSNASIDLTLPTAIIFWNRTIGISKENNIFENEKKLIQKFNGNINILLVNTDANDAWPYDLRIKYIALLKKVVENLKAVEAF